MSKIDTKSYKSDAESTQPSDIIEPIASNMSETSSEGDGESKKTFSVMDKRVMFNVIEDGIDVTPDNITDNAYITMKDPFVHAAFVSKPQGREVADVDTKAQEKTEKGMKVYETTISLDDIYIDHTLNTEEGVSMDETSLELAISSYFLQKKQAVMTYPPNFFLILKETETVFLFELPNFSCEKGTNEANIVEQDNAFYQYITVGKGRNRKMVNEETQTQSAITQSRHTLATQPQTKNVSSFAATWDMHDTYAKLAKQTSTEEEDEMVMYMCAAESLLRKKKHIVDKGSQGDGTEALLKSQQFLDAVLLIDRVLASKIYSNEQKKFRGLVQTNPMSLELKYTYTLKPLWTFEHKDTINRPITCVSFNPKNEDILAVGHGKFTFAENHDGIICIWCTKNPCEPERLYRFKDPVTSLSFSDLNPNWLACGFANGDVIILDITKYKTSIVAKSKRDTNPCFEPIWTMIWRKNENQTENVITTCQDGRINRFTNTKTHDFICTPMMRICSVEGKMKGLEATKTCGQMDVPITRYPAVLCTQWHPRIDHVYNVGTDEGCIHKCSMHYLNQHMDVFKAHSGPVYGITHSPFMKRLLVSCGADNAIRMWMEGVDDVIMCLNCSAAVYGISFCPINSTILISISGNAISVWDLRRKTHIPCAEYHFPGSVVLTYVKFTSSGDNVIVADSHGRIHTFHLEDVPIAPFYQKKMLEDAIKKALCTRPHLLKQIEKLDKILI